MKKTLKGKEYNTETAVKVGKCSFIQGDKTPKNDDELQNVDNEIKYTESLYRKKIGEFFLCGEGGEESKYGEFSYKEGKRIPSTEIIPLTWEQARNWGKQYLNKETYDKYFSDNNEDELIATKVSAATKHKLFEITSYYKVPQRTVLDNIFKVLTIEQYNELFNPSPTLLSDSSTNYSSQ